MPKSWTTLSCSELGDLTCEEWSKLPCGIPVGFDGPAWPGVVGCGNISPIENLNTDLSRLADCVAVFCGPNDQCGVGIHFTPDQYYEIGDWVSHGGRLWCNGEYNVDDVGGVDCLGTYARDDINQFMFTLGASMQVGHHACNCNCTDSYGEPWLGINGPARIVNQPTTLPGIYHACTGEVTGGTIVNRTEPVKDDSGSGDVCLTSYVWCAIEKIGDGFVVLTGDSNVFGGCAFDNCAIASRFINNDSGDMV